jgi:(S)-2-hydroxyglutarate dehydrogenase
MQKYDCVIIGGGIVGLSVAWAILERKPDIRVTVLEKEDDWAQHQTGRNSGVIHSGIYYKPGSLKAKLCREGNRRLVEFCDLYGVPYEACGKVIAATTASELPLLEKLYGRGIANGLAVRKLAASEMNEIEPHVSCLAGIHVPSTGIVDFAAVCRKLAQLIAARGGQLRLGTKVLGLRTNEKEGVLETSQGAFAARWIINCAGLYSDRIARLAGHTARGAHRAFPR